MDILFTTDLTLNGKSETFNVTFHNEQYIFQSISSNTHFSIRREEDEWHAVGDLDQQVKNEASEKLESYLLSQH